MTESVALEYAPACALPSPCVDPPCDNALPTNRFLCFEIPYSDALMSDTGSADRGGSTAPRALQSGGLQRWEVPSIPLKQTLSKRHSTRKRRPNLRPILRGTNPYGRGGTRRCVQCRKWKQKCDYGTVDLPCALCKSRGFPCGAEEKIWGPNKCSKLEPQSHCGESEEETSVDRSLSVVTDEAIIGFDSKYIDYIMRRLRFPEFLPPEIGSILKIRGITGHILGNPVSMTMAIPWPDRVTLESRPFRSAVLAVSSSLFEGENNKVHTLTYLSHYYKFAQEAIEASALTELIAATYTILLYSYLADESFETLLHHFKGLSTGIALLHQTRSNELKWVEVLWRAGLQLLLRKFWKRNQFKHIPQGELGLLIDLYVFLKQYSCYAKASLDDSPINSSYTRLETLGCLLSLYWDLYLALQQTGTSPGTLRPLIQSIKQAVEEILALVPELPNPRELLLRAEADIRLWCPTYPEVQHKYVHSTTIQPSSQLTFEDERAALLYAYAELLHVFIQSPMHLEASDCVSPALLLSRLCAPAVDGYLPRSSPFALQITRYLFWAGLVLKKMKLPVGEIDIFSMLMVVNNLIMKALRSARDAQIAEKPQRKEEMGYIFHCIFDLFEKAEYCESLQEILTLESHRASVLQCYRLAGRVYFLLLAQY